MIHCEKGHENPEGALFCKECGIKFETPKNINLIPFKTSYYKWHWTTKTTFIILIISLVNTVLSKVLMNFNIVYLLHEMFFLRYLVGIVGIVLFLPVSSVLFVICFYVFNRRWKKFNLTFKYSEAKDTIFQFVFTQNKLEEKFQLQENQKGQLKLKDKSLGAKGLFHLVADMDGNALLIGEKYNTQSLIRMVFGKDINFIEK